MPRHLARKGVQLTKEISEAHLRVGMDLEAPVPSIPCTDAYGSLDRAGFGPC